MQRLDAELSWLSSHLCQSHLVSQGHTHTKPPTFTITHTHTCERIKAWALNIPVCDAPVWEEWGSSLFSPSYTTHRRTAALIQGQSALPPASSSRSSETLRVTVQCFSADLCKHWEKTPNASEPLLRVSEHKSTFKTMGLNLNCLIFFRREMQLFYRISLYKVRFITRP